MKRLENPLIRCEDDFKKWVKQYQDALAETFGNRWSDEEVEKTAEEWFPMWQTAFADGMNFMEDITLGRVEIKSVNTSNDLEEK